jgi:hypothetical protein
MPKRTLVAAAVLASFLVAGIARAASGSTPVFYLRIEGVGGTVDMSPAPTLLRDCTSYCAYRFPTGTMSVRLYAHSSYGRFAQWGSFDSRYPPPCGGTSATCTFTPSRTASMRAFFSPVAVIVHDDEHGTASVDGRSCGQGCGLFDYGAVAHLTATPHDGYVFHGWSELCGGHGSTCNITVHSNHETTALFTCRDPSACSNGSPVTTPITITVKVTGPGHVLGPSGMNCRSNKTCSASADLGTQVTLRAVADAGRLRNWASNVSCRSSVCQFPAIMNANGRSPLVVANFG